MMSHIPNVNKDSIRRNYDKTIIKRFRTHKGTQLTYFGLPGRDMSDVMEWRQHIGRILAVERDDIERHLLMVKAFETSLDKRLRVFVGDIDNLLTKGYDEYNTPLDSAFDLINLDYYGGLVCKDLKGESKRIEALRKLFERERNAKQDFLLLLTFNTRNRDDQEFKKTLDQVELELASLRLNVSSDIEWYKEARYDYKLKVYVLYTLDKIAAANRFSFSLKTLQPPVTYLGSSNRRMVHFAIPFDYSKEVAGVGRSHSSVEILNLPMLECTEGKLQRCNIQPPLLKIIAE